MQVMACQTLAKLCQPLAVRESSPARTASAGDSSLSCSSQQNTPAVQVGPPTPCCLAVLAASTALVVVGQAACLACLLLACLLLACLLLLNLLLLLLR